jgi:hypothetical protein
MSEGWVILLYLGLSFLGFVASVLERIWKNWRGPEYPGLSPLSGHSMPTATSPELDDICWEEMEPEEDPQPARFRRWDD